MEPFDKWTNEQLTWAESRLLRLACFPQRGKATLPDWSVGRLAAAGQKSDPPHLPPSLLVSTGLVSKKRTLAFKEPKKATDLTLHVVIYCTRT
jgi:hypothetical protein